MAAEMSTRLGWLQPAERDRVVQLLERLGLPVAAAAHRRAARTGAHGNGQESARADAFAWCCCRELGRAAVVDDYAEQALEATLQAHFG